MKNIVKVIRHNAEKPRLYTLPDGVSVKAGTLVTVEYRDKSTVTGVAVSDSYVVDGETEKMVIDLMHIIPPTLDDLKRVVSLHDERPVVWPEDDDSDDDAEQEDE